MAFVASLPAERRRALAEDLSAHAGRIRADWPVPSPAWLAADPGSDHRAAGRRASAAVGGHRPCLRRPGPRPGVGVPRRGEIRAPGASSTVPTSTSTPCSRPCDREPRRSGRPPTTRPPASSTSSRSARTCSSGPSSGSCCAATRRMCRLAAGARCRGPRPTRCAPGVSASRGAFRVKSVPARTCPRRRTPTVSEVRGVSDLVPASVGAWRPTALTDALSACRRSSSPPARVRTGSGPTSSGSSARWWPTCPPGEQLVLDAHRLRIAITDPERCGADEDFVPFPGLTRRAIGVAALARWAVAAPAPPRPPSPTCWRSASTISPAPGIRPWPAECARRGGPSGIRAHLGVGGRAVVEAEAVTWATQLAGALAWERLDPPAGRRWPRRLVVTAPAPGS